MNQIITILLQSSLYFIIPFIPALILRVKRPKTAPWIAAVSTIIGGLCLIISLICLFLSEDMFSPVNMALSYAAFCVPCSLPGLYCLAFYDNSRKIWLALIPPAVFFAYWFARYWITPYTGFTGAFEALITGIPGDESMLITYIAIIYGICALLCVLAAILFARINALKAIKKEI